MFFIAYTFKGQVHVFAGGVKIESHLSCRTSTIFKYFFPLFRFPVYFQMDKGVVLEDSIVVADEEPVDILNIKRGLISQLQFPFLESLTTTVEVCS